MPTLCVTHSITAQFGGLINSITQTVSAVLSFFLAATVYPEVLKKAQAEIDRVVGPDRLPNFADRGSLPYIDWIVWECLRWNPGA